MQEVLVVNKAKRTTISISQPTKHILDSIKHPGQSYDGLIQELIKLWEKEHGEKISK
ncbi:hypothetical protein ES703_32316 [subsurface metagenome]